jgi:energy-converting hydrogenase Eha subunit H
MAYEEDHKAAIRWEKIRWGSLVVGVSLWVVEKACKVDLTVLVTGCWLFAALAVVLQARAAGRMGRSTGALYIYALFLAVLGVSFLY